MLGVGEEESQPLPPGESQVAASPHLVLLWESVGPDLGQSSPLPLVNLKPDSALIGPEVYSVAPPAILCHKELARGKQL